MRAGNKLFIATLVVLLIIPVTVSGFDFGKAMDSVGKAVKSGVEKVEKKVDNLTSDGKQEKEQRQSKPAASTPQKNSKSAAYNKKSEAPVQGGAVSGTNGSLFSKSPINPENLPQPVTAFEAGDHIYGILKCKESWKTSTRGTYILMYLFVDGKQKAYKSVNMRRADLYNSDFFIIDIAPEPGEMVNYSDRDIVWPEVNGYKFGPELFTKILSELSGGTHRIKLEVKSYGKTHAAAEFTITGSNYQAYGDLLAGIKAGASKQQKMPRIGMTDMSLQEEMVKILKNRGWPKIERFIIVDKDWWIDRESGGNSRVVSRHIAGVAAAKDGNGGYYYSKVTFHKQKLLSGAWGPLELTHTGEKKPILKENINM